MHEALATVCARGSEHVQRPADVDAPVVVVGVRDVAKRGGEVIDAFAALRRFRDVAGVRELAFDNLDARVRQRPGALARANERAHDATCRLQRVGEVLA